MADKSDSAPLETGGLIFALLNEAGIISQLARAEIELRNPDGLTMPQFSVLNHLARLGGTPSPLSLAKAFQVPKTSMTHTLAGLEKNGFIEMNPNPDDGRSKLVQMTGAGQNARERAIAAIIDEIMRMGEDIGIDRIQTALPILRDIRIWMDKARD